MKWSELSVSALAVALLILMGTVVFQVLFSALDINPVASFSSALPLLGDAITLNSLLDAQWHLLVTSGLLPAGLIWLWDKHVRVDFIYQSRSERAKARINLFGNFIFAAPFLVLAIPASWDFMLRA